MAMDKEREAPVARVKRNSGCNGREFIGESLEFRDLPVGTKLYAAPSSGLLRAADHARIELGGIRVEDDPMSDNLAIALCSYFSSHMNRPYDDDDTDNGWGEWVEKKANDALDIITKAIRAEAARVEPQTALSDNAMAPVKEDAPVMKAWVNYKARNDFQNTRKWALHEEHVNGSLWAAFYAGYFACAVDSTNPSAPDQQQGVVTVPDDRGWPIVVNKTLKATGAKAISERMSPHDENTRCSWIESADGKGICDISNEAYFVLRDEGRRPA